MSKTNLGWYGSPVSGLLKVKQKGCVPAISNGKNEEERRILWESWVKSLFNARSFCNRSRLKITNTKFYLTFIQVRRSNGKDQWWSGVPFRVSFDPEDLRIEGNPFPSTLSLRTKCRMNPNPRPPAMGSG